MSHIAYVNGQYVRRDLAVVSIEDRGYQFADGIYEVICIRNGRFVDATRHLDRLDRSLAELRIEPPMARRPMTLVMRELVRRNRVDDGILYMQVTRGVAWRDHAFPAEARSAFVMTVTRMRLPDEESLMKGVAVITIPDIRWKRRDIKSISLLPNILGKQQAREAGVYEAWMVEDDGMVTEGTSSNAWIVTADNELVTRRADVNILNGVTRLAVLDVVAARKMRFSERPFTVAEAKQARETFLTSSTSFVKPIVTIDGQAVGNGKVGPVCEALVKAYFARIGDPATGA